MKSLTRELRAMQQPVADLTAKGPRELKRMLNQYPTCPKVIGQLPEAKFKEQQMWALAHRLSLRKTIEQGEYHKA